MRFHLPIEHGRASSPQVNTPYKLMTKQAHHSASGRYDGREKGFADARPTGSNTTMVTPLNPPTPRFATTRWSIVLAAGHDSSPDSQVALAALCSTYWFPLYAYVRRRDPDVNEAHDLTQAFFTEVLEKNYVGTAEPGRGRFRAFLLTAFKNFLAKNWQAEKAQKRGGRKTPIPLDFEAADSQIQIQPTGGLTPEELYKRDWAVALLDQIMTQLEEELRQSGKVEQFQILRAFLVGSHSGTTYHDAAEQLDMTEAAAKMVATRMRRRYRELLREEIAQTVSNANEIDDEIRNLFETLARRS